MHFFGDEGVDDDDSGDEGIGTPAATQAAARCAAASALFDASAWMRATLDPGTLFAAYTPDTGVLAPYFVGGHHLATASLLGVVATRKVET